MTAHCTLHSFLLSCFMPPLALPFYVSASASSRVGPSVSASNPSFMPPLALPFCVSASASSRVAASASALARAAATTPSAAASSARICTAEASALALAAASRSAKVGVSSAPTPATFKVGEQVWAHTGTEACFELGKIERLDGHKGTVAVRFKASTIDVKEADVHKVPAARRRPLGAPTPHRTAASATCIFSPSHPRPRAFRAAR